MKKALLYISVGILSFMIGLAGFYYAMPYLQPDTVESVRAELDSLRALRSDSLGLDLDQLEDADMFADLVLADTVAIDSLTGDTLVTPTISVYEHPAYLALLDSLSGWKSQASLLKAEAAQIAGRLEQIESRIEVEVAAATDIADLTTTLSRLEDNELRPILERIDDATVARLYQEATGRNRTKIVRAMPSDRAARLVQRMMGQSSARQQEQPPAVTTSTADQL
jgi:hypothetical protein